MVLTVDVGPVVVVERDLGRSTGSKHEEDCITFGY